MRMQKSSRREFTLAIGAIFATASTSIAAAPAACGAEQKIEIEARRTALVLIDFQSSNAEIPFKPHPFDRVVDNAARLAVSLRSAGGLVIHTRVAVADMLDLPADEPLPSGPAKPGGDVLVSRLQPQPGDVVVTKRQWGAFYGTDLEQQLRRHDIRWLMIAGVATEVGVESTAREAYDRGYPIVFVEDAISGATVGTHEMFLEKLFPRMGLVRSSSDAIGMLKP